MTTKYSQTTISPKKIYEEISKTVVGQHTAKVAMSELLFMHFLRIVESMQTGKPITKKSNGLIMGPSGSGKTFIIREGAKAIRTLIGQDSLFDILEIDCTAMSPKGWSGDNFEDMLVDFANTVEAKREGAFAHSIVFLDEFDKLCIPAVGSGGTDHNKNTQYSLLKAVEGTPLSVEGNKKRAGITLDTSGVLFIMAGNFQQIRRNREKDGHTIGFKDGVKRAEDFDMHQQLEDGGMATQLVGRTSHIAELEYLSELDLRTILEIQVIPEYASLWKTAHKRLKISEEDKDFIVKQAFKRKTGARGLHADFARVTKDQMFNLEYKF